MMKDNDYSQHQEYGRYGYCYKGESTWICGNAPKDFVQYCDNCFKHPELATNWNEYPNINLLPYLISGKNTIFIRVIVYGKGEGAIKISTRQQCPMNCVVSTHNQCADLEARSQ